MSSIIQENLNWLCSRLPELKKKTLLLGLDTTVVTSFGPRFLSKSYCHGGGGGLPCLEL